MNSRRARELRTCVMLTETRGGLKGDLGTADERWAAWVAKGVGYDRKIRKRAIAAAAVIASGLTLWLVIVLLLG